MQMHRTFFVFIFSALKMRKISERNRIQDLRLIISNLNVISANNTLSIRKGKKNVFEVKRRRKAHHKIITFIHHRQLIYQLAC